jgi:hypothetical protein
VTATREAFVLPLLFLTVALVGGLRTAAQIRLVPPPLAALVLGMLLMAALTRGRVLLPDIFMNATRRPIENANGAIVILTLFASSAQVFNLLIPDRGLFYAIFTVFFAVQLLTTLAAVDDRRRMLRALSVLFGSAFVLRYIVLEALYAADSTVLKRMLTVLLEGITLGGLGYDPHAATTGYTAFAALALYMIGLALLSASRPSTALERRPRESMTLPTQTAIVLLLVAAAGCRGAQAPSGEAGAPVAEAPTAEHARLAQIRDEALRAARVWRQPPIAVRQADLRENPPGPTFIKTTDDVTCRFRPDRVGGTTPKFNCELPGGEVVKVKYGAGNAEIHGEVAASRLLSALGFGADRMYLVRNVICQGCPAFPFQALKCAEQTRLEKACFPGGINYATSNTFAPAVIERRMPGKTIEAADGQGWAWYELDRIDAAHRGSPRHEVDALRLVAIVLAHWDNKSENQRLICPPGAEQEGDRCTAPLALIQDLGATFGPVKLDLGNWRATPVWADARTCRVSMKTMPFDGGTFPDAQISEEGRRMLLGLLEQLSTEQLTDLFTGSGVTGFDSLSAEARDSHAWANAFRDKIRQLRDAGPCPAAATLTGRAES